MIGLILAGLVAVVVILGAARPARVLILGVLGLSAVGLLVVWLDYGTIEPCDILTVQVADRIAEGIETKLAATADEQVIENFLGLLVQQYAATIGPQSPGQCLGLLMSGWHLRGNNKSGFHVHAGGTPR